MNITIIGAGGVGGYFGGRLALAGNEVTFIARGIQLEAIQKNGLSIVSPLGNFLINPVNATSGYNSINKSDLVLVCTKAWQVKEIARQIAPLIGEDTMVLPLQNGVLAAKELTDFMPGKNVIGGLCRIFSKIESPGVISHFGSEPTIIFGELNNTKSERINRLSQTFTHAGFSCRLSDDILADMWKKFLMICSSALLAVTRTNYGEMRTLPETRALLHEMYTEIYHIGIARSESA